MLAHLYTALVVHKLICDIVVELMRDYLVACVPAGSITYGLALAACKHGC